MRGFKFSGLFLACLIAVPAWGRVPVPAATPEAIAYHRGLDLFWLADLASLPLLLLGVSVVILITTPGQMAFERSIEHEADRFGLEITQNNDAAATGQPLVYGDRIKAP